MFNFIILNNKILKYTVLVKIVIIFRLALETKVQKARGKQLTGRQFIAPKQQ